ncbi:hypothetical protein NQ318_011347 [Aromia moschata]|uniref:Uncharacterized protein n=1 Tax=Aromia moschata TaxID=1265417 RepID=A0AAV8XG81_9CUCU|nr:hypothetical protein NQ318_011347 [Aromia moschata]
MAWKYLCRDTFPPRKHEVVTNRDPIASAGVWQTSDLSMELFGLKFEIAFLPSESEHLDFLDIWGSVKLMNKWQPSDSKWERSKMKMKKYMQQIINYIRVNDLVEPLKILASDRESAGNMSNSIYRDILFLACKALGRSLIDINAFDKEYTNAYSRISAICVLFELETKCDLRTLDWATTFRGASPLALCSGQTTQTAPFSTNFTSESMFGWPTSQFWQKEYHNTDSVSHKLLEKINRYGIGDRLHTCHFHYGATVWDLMIMFIP